MPSLDLGAIAPSNSIFSPSPAYRRNSAAIAPQDAAQNSYSSDDPWQRVSEVNGGNASLTNGAPSSISGTGLPRDWWKRQERAQVQIVGMHGFILNRYMLYAVASDVSALPFVLSRDLTFTSSEVLQYHVGIRSLCICGNVSLGAILSEFYLNYHPSGLVVSAPFTC